MNLALNAEPTGVFFTAVCDLQLEGCTARVPAPVTAVKVGPGDESVIVCRSCLERMVQDGEWAVRGARITARPDFTLDDPLGQPVVAIEVKGAPRHPSVDLDHWASSVRRNLLAHGAAPGAPYFLLFFVPEAGYLWSSAERPFDALPDYRIELSDFGSSTDGTPRAASNAVEAWVLNSLEAITDGRFVPQGAWWTESGLGGAIRGGGLKLVPGGPANFVRRSRP